MHLLTTKLRSPSDPNTAKDSGGLTFEKSFTLSVIKPQLVTTVEAQELIDDQG